MCCKKDIDERWYFIAAVDAMYWYVHRNDKKEGEDVRPPPGPPEPIDPTQGGA
jgi:hypothetical protein